MTATRPAVVAGVVVGCLAAALYASTLPAYGLVSDEGNYFESSRRLFGWAKHFLQSLEAGEPGRSFDATVLADSWAWGGDRIPHPPFSREVAGLSGFLFYGHMDPLVAYRLIGSVLAGVLAGGVAAWAGVRAGTPAGLVAGLAFLLMPRVFAHAHFADTDFLLSGLFFFALFSAVEARRAPLAIAGALWGLALATKFSAVLLPLILIPWLAVFRRDRLRQLPLFFLAGVVAFAAVNPAVWADPLGYVREYVHQGLARRHIRLAQLPTFYLGRLYTYRPPWHYLPLMLLLTTPVGVLLLAAGGGRAGVTRSDTRAIATLAVLVCATFLGALTLPSAPLHDDIRLLLPIFPFVALLAGLGAAWLLKPGRLRGARWALVALALGDAALATFDTHPFQSSYFNQLAGGISGAERRGLEVSVMKDALNRDVYADLNRFLPPHASLDGGPFLYEDLLFAQDVGWLRSDLEIRSGPPSDYVLVVNRRGWFRPLDRALFDFSRPTYAVRLADVPLVALYRLR